MYCEDRKSHQCWPSYKTIGRAVDMSENTVRKYVRELEYKTLIFTEPTKYESTDGQVRNGNLIFTMLPIQGAVKYHNEVPIIQVGVCDPCEGYVRRTGAALEEVKREQSQNAVLGHLWRFVKGTGHASSSGAKPPRATAQTRCKDIR